MAPSTGAIFLLNVTSAKRFGIWADKLPARDSRAGGLLRLNGVGSLRRSDSILNSCSAGTRSRKQNGPKVGIAAANMVGLRARVRLPGTEFLDAETKRQKSSFKRANACRDQNPGIKWPEIPAETPYSESYRKRAVCEDWMVVCTVTREPVSAATPCYSLLFAFFQGRNPCLLL